FDRVDLGLSYLSQVSFTADGTREAGIPPVLQQLLGLPAKITFRNEQLVVRMPQIYRLGAAVHPAHHVTLVFEIQDLYREHEKFLLKNHGSTRPDVLPDNEEPL